MADTWHVSIGHIDSQSHHRNWPGHNTLQKTMLKASTKTDVQMLFKEIQGQIENMTLGYGLMNLVEDNSLDWKPLMVAYSINPRPVNHTFIKDFQTKVDKHSLQNKNAEYALIIGIHQGWVVEGSLQGIQGGIYRNHTYCMDIKRNRSGMWDDLV